MSVPRRELLQIGSAFAAATLAGYRCVEAAAEDHASPNRPAALISRAEASSIATPRLALNTSTLRGQQLTVPEQISVTADAGYDGIELWIRDLRAYLQAGGTVSELRSQLDSAELELSGAIGFATWIVDDEAEREAGLEEARRDMKLVAELGGKFIAAPPVGAHRPEMLAGGRPLDLDVIARRYATLLETGQKLGVTPLLELWGFSLTLSRLAELAYVATAAGSDAAAVLPDFYHLYKGGNPMAGLGMIEAQRMPLFHINDYPAEPARETISDEHRVFPGDGICPLVPTIAMLLRHGFAGTFSLELFNREYWGRPASEVAAEGARKCRRVIAAAVEAAKSPTGDRV